MRMQWGVFVAVSLWSVVSGPLTKADATDAIGNQTAEQGSRNISIVGNNFMVDGKQLRIVSGSLHYFRVPAPYWRDRMRKMKAAGLNSVATYVEWSFHEPEERQYSFEGDRDVVKFIRTAAEEGLYVLLRVGPYICSERDLGGFPYWLIGKYPNIRLRSTNKDYMTESEIWLNKLFEQVSPLLYANGGPIILVQVENEYGSYDNDEEYRVEVRDMMHKHVGSKAILYTTDGNFFGDGAIPKTLTTIDFNAFLNVTKLFKMLRQFMPEGPLMNSEFYTGWLTHWGEGMADTSAELVVHTLGQILDYGASVNLYMFSGGSNFEYTAGADYPYKPDITSYDYDSPLSEAGDPTPKYYLIRDKLKQYNFVDESIPVPTASPKGDYGLVNVTPTVNLLSPEGRAQLGKKYPDYTGPTLPTFEHLRQRGGLMLYETTLTEAEGLLEIKKPRDLIFVYIDGKIKDCISRIHNLYSLTLSAKNGSVLSLLVEPQGRVGSSSGVLDYKGILSNVEFNNVALAGKWKITGFPLETFDTSSVRSQSPGRPTFYEGDFTLPAGAAPLDTFVDTSGWGKGYIWVNGHNLGRYWPSAGPQITLYLPGLWLKPAPEKNHLQILELGEPPQVAAMDFIDRPVLDRKGNINLLEVLISSPTF